MDGSCCSSTSSDYSTQGCISAGTKRVVPGDWGRVGALVHVPHLDTIPHQPLRLFEVQCRVRLPRLEAVPACVHVCTHAREGPFPHCTCMTGQFARDISLWQTHQSCVGTTRNSSLWRSRIAYLIQAHMDRSAMLTGYRRRGPDLDSLSSSLPMNVLLLSSSSRIQGRTSSVSTVDVASTPALHEDIPDRRMRNMQRRKQHTSWSDEPLRIFTGRGNFFRRLLLHHLHSCHGARQSNHITHP